jgi:hypothetical protein
LSDFPDKLEHAPLPVWMGRNMIRAASLLWLRSQLKRCRLITQRLCPRRYL